MGSPLQEIAKSHLPEAAQLAIVDEHPDMHDDLVACPTLTDTAFAALYPQLPAALRGRLLRQKRLTAARINVALSHETKRGPLNVLVDLAEEELTAEQWMTLASKERLDAEIAARIVTSPCAPGPARATAVRSSGVAAALSWHAANVHTGTVEADSTLDAVAAALQHPDQLDRDATTQLAHIARGCPQVTGLLFEDRVGRAALAMLPYDPQVHPRLLDEAGTAGDLLVLAESLDLPDEARLAAWQKATGHVPGPRMVADGHLPPDRVRGSDGIPFDRISDPEVLDAVVWNLDRMSGLGQLLRAVQLAGNPNLDELHAARVLSRIAAASSDQCAYLRAEASQRICERFDDPAGLIGEWGWARLHKPVSDIPQWRDGRAKYKAMSPSATHSWGWAEPEQLESTSIAGLKGYWDVCGAYGRDDTKAVWTWVLKLVKAGYRPCTVGELFAPARLFAEESDPAVLEVVETLLDPDCDPARVLDAARAALTAA